MKSLMFAVLAGPTALAAACGSATTGVTAFPSATTAATAATTSSATAPSAAVSVCPANPAPANATQVVVGQPAAQAQVTSPLTVSGEVNAFEASFLIAIKDASGSDIVTKTGHSPQGQVLAPFSESVPFTVTQQTPACLWVFQSSPKDGTPSAVQQVPITLMP